MPWDPVRDLLTMQERLESLFGRATPGWVPPVDLSELDDRYQVTMELPGLSRPDVTIEFADQVVTIKGTRPQVDCHPERYQQLERGQGGFARSFKFAQPVDGEAITAELTEGVLTVIVPRSTTGRRRIEVS